MLFLQDPSNKNIAAYKAPSPSALAPPIAAYPTRTPPGILCPSTDGSDLLSSHKEAQHNIRWL